MDAFYINPFLEISRQDCPPALKQDITSALSIKIYECHMTTKDIALTIAQSDDDYVMIRRELCKTLSLHSDHLTDFAFILSELRDILKSKKQTLPSLLPAMDLVIDQIQEFALYADRMSEHLEYTIARKDTDRFLVERDHRRSEINVRSVSDKIALVDPILNQAADLLFGKTLNQICDHISAKNWDYYLVETSPRYVIMRTVLKMKQAQVA